MLKNSWLRSSAEPGKASELDERWGESSVAAMEVSHATNSRA